MSSSVTLLVLVGITATVVTAWVAHRLVMRVRPAVEPLLADLPLGWPRAGQVYPWITAILAAHTAVALLIRGVERQLFVPNLALPYTLAGGSLALLEIVVALTLLGGIVVGALVRPAAVGLAILGLLGMFYFGPLLIVEHLYFLGIAAFLFIVGSSPAKVPYVVSGRGRPLLGLLPYAVPVVRVSFGAATLLTGFTEKVWNHDLALAFLSEHPFNVTTWTPFPITDTHFVIGAGVAEASLGALLLSGLFPRAVILAAWVPFNLAVPFLGATDVLGHLPIYGILLTILLCGTGRGFAAALRRETEPRSAPHQPLTPSTPDRVGRVGRPSMLEHVNRLRPDRLR